MEQEQNTESKKVILRAIYKYSSEEDHETIDFKDIKTGDIFRILDKDNERNGTRISTWLLAVSDAYLDENNQYMLDIETAEEDTYDSIVKLRNEK